MKKLYIIALISILPVTGLQAANHLNDSGIFSANSSVITPGSGCSVSGSDKNDESDGGDAPNLVQLKTGAMVNSDGRGLDVKKATNQVESKRKGLVE